MLKERTFALQMSSTSSSKRKASSFEDSNEKLKNAKRRAPAVCLLADLEALADSQQKKNATSSKISSRNEAPKFQVDDVAGVVFGGFRLTKILAKGWQTPLGASKACWCYLVEWEEDTATGTKTGDTTWEPVNSMKRDQGMMAELFESRMLEESRKGPPSWEDVKVSSTKLRTEHFADFL